MTEESVMSLCNQGQYIMRGTYNFTEAAEAMNQRRREIERKRVKRAAKKNPVPPIDVPDSNTNLQTI